MLLALLGHSPAAHAAPPDAPATIQLEATVSDNYRELTGTLTGLPPGTPLRDPLAGLPEPTSDLQRFRTFPGAPNQGQITWEAAPDGTLTFHTRLPRRFGALGAFRHRGLFANGGWYPQPDDALAEHRWQVHVTLPEGALGGLGDQAGRDTLVWQGLAERVPLAVLPHGRLTELPSAQRPLTLLTRHKPRKTFSTVLSESHAALSAPGLRPQLVVVEAPMRRRLVRPGPGIAFVSDRAGRVSLGLQRIHRVALTRGLAAALAPTSDAQTRELVAITISDAWAAELRGTSAGRALKLVSWMPSIDRLIATRRTPFFGDIFEERFPSDPVQDDLAERFTPTVGGAVLADQLDDRYGPGTAAALAHSVLAGQSLAEAAGTQGVDPALLASFRQAYPAQDYQLDVADDHLQVRRLAPANAPQEQLTVRVDQHDIALQLAPGQALDIPLSAPPSKVTLDPAGHVRQTSRAGDLWPPTRSTPTFSAGITGVNLTRFRIEGSGSMSWRRRFDTRNRYFGSLYTSRGTDVGASLAYSRAFGPLVDGFRRTSSIVPSVQVGVLNPRFSNTTEGRVSMSGGVSLGNDSRVSTSFPLEGVATSASLRAGGIPGSGRLWTQLSGGIAGTLPLHPRHAISLGVSSVLAYATRPDAWPSPASAMLGFPVRPTCGVTDETTDCITPAKGWVRATAVYRFAPIRNASVPLLLGWGNEVQVEVGVEVMQAVLTNNESARGASLLLGLHGIGDVFGVEPQKVGLRAGWALWVDGFGGVRALPPYPEVVLAW